MNEIAQASKSAKIWGWITLVLGILAVLSPMVSGLAVAIMVAILLVIAGVTRLVYAFQGGGFWTGVFGVLAIAAGLFMLGRPLPGLISLTMVLIAYFLAMGISEIVAAIQIRPTQGWGFVLFSGIVSVILGFLIWNQWPLSAAWAIGVLVGIQLLFAGMTMITVGSVIKEASTV